MLFSWRLLTPAPRWCVSPQNGVTAVSVWIHSLLVSGAERADFLPTSSHASSQPKIRCLSSIDQPSYIYNFNLQTDSYVCIRCNRSRAMPIPASLSATSSMRHQPSPSVTRGVELSNAYPGIAFRKVDIEENSKAAANAAIRDVRDVCVRYVTCVYDT